MRKLPILLLPMLLVYCNTVSEKDFLGSAVIESYVYQTASLNQGSLVMLSKKEGDFVAVGETLAIIDTIPLVLKKNELQSAFQEIQATIISKRSDIEAAEAEQKGVKREFDRISSLAQKGSVPQREKDNLQTQYTVTQSRLESAKAMLSSLQNKLYGMAIKIEQVQNQIDECFVTSPVSGVVFTQYRNSGEIVGAANPIYEIGTVDTVYADFFIPQPTLATIKLLQTVAIRIDYGTKSDSALYLPATITWIGNEAEFSPKNIQTRESRNELVFRVRATIQNSDMVLKRGLPVEVWRNHNMQNLGNR